MSESTGWDSHVHVFDATAPTLPGHYAPSTRTLAEIETTAAAHGIRHLVLVQPSVYGSDNRLLLQALQEEPGRHRGVVVLPDPVSDAELDALHASGVRGVRFNCVSPVRPAVDPATALQALAHRLRQRGWHVQWYVRSSDLAALVPLQAATGLVFVLDHLAGIAAGTPPQSEAWSHLQALAAAGAWVKLSGWYRLNAALPFDSLHDHIRRIATLFVDRMVWGSDWPHTSWPAHVPLPYAATWAPVVGALGEAAAQRLHESARRLYA